MDTKHICKQCGKLFNDYEVLVIHSKGWHKDYFLQVLNWIDSSTPLEYNDFRGET